jgi:pimeloyl-ACP methyl ester carboxylesterase
MQDMPDWTDLVRAWASAPLRLALEWRVGVEWGSLMAAQPFLNLMPQGDGHPVLVLPYLFGTDLGTQPLRASLAHLGYAARAWESGVNLGPREGVMERALERLQEVQRECGRTVSLIGWSAGGLYARELAKQAPKLVRQVITLGTPITGVPRPAEVWRMVESTTGQPYGIPEAQGSLEAPPPVPTTAIFSRTDGIVPWPDSIQREGPITENVEVESSHFGLGLNPLVLFVIADRLAQPEGEWRAFQREGLKAALYPDPQRRSLF